MWNKAPNIHNVFLKFNLVEGRQVHYIIMKSKSKRSTKVEEKEQEISIASFWETYSSHTTPRMRLIDLFIVYLLVLVKCQVFYRMIVGDDFPRNAFVSGIFCPLGVAVLLVILRGTKSLDFRQLAEFFIACIVLFITSINFAG